MVTSAPGLCMWCSNRFQRLKPKNYRFEYVYDSRRFKDICESGQEGCHVCLLLNAGITAVHGEREVEANLRIETRIVVGVDKLQYTIVFRMMNPTTSQMGNFQFCSLQGDPHFTKGSALMMVDDAFMPTPLSFLAIPKEIVANTRVDECVYLAKQWIALCHETHLICHHYQLSRLPTRVIDVGSDYRHDCPRLVEPGAQADRYIALSHCWGNGRHFTTETTNIQERLKGMRWELLPKTFQDAISITRKLGIQYLWIDSLCILQDDSADWDQELSRMSDVYKNSFLTIAAVSAENDQAGFLDSTLWRVPIKLPPLLNFGSDLKIWQAMDYRESNSIREPLSTRAWAFQERLVPQRVLSFRSNQMRWECSNSTWSEAEDSPCYKVEKIANKGARELYHKALRCEDDLPLESCAISTEFAINSESNHPQVYHWWRKEIITTYAKLHITKEADRLPALSAIANEMQLKIQDTYLAGLWKRDLLLGLLWLSSSCPDWPIPGSAIDDYRAEPGYLPDKYRAPSWSWASIESDNLAYANGIIMEEGLTARILEAECQLSGISRTGEVSGGFIRLSARWFPAKLEVIEDLDCKTKYNIVHSMSAPSHYNTLRSEFFWPDVPMEASISPSGHAALQTSVQRSSYDSQLTISGTVSCVLIAMLGGGYFAFMVLGQASSRAGAFERLGIYKVHHIFLIEGWCDSLDVREFLVI